jgi:anthranilate synthase component 1
VFEVVRQFEHGIDEFTVHLDKPIMEFGIYNDGILYDNKKKQFFYFFYDEDRRDKIKKTEEEIGGFEISDIIPNLNKDEFEKIVTKAKEYVHSGDVFQVVLSRKFSFEGKGDYLKVYEKLRRLNPSPYMFHLRMNSFNGYVSFICCIAPIL